MRSNTTVSQNRRESARRREAPRSVRGSASVWTLVAILLLAAVLHSCSFLNMSIPEIVGAIQRNEPLLDRGLYDLENALENREPEVILRETNWDSQVCAWFRLEPFLRDYLQADPLRYYVDIKNTKIGFAGSLTDRTCVLEIAYFDELTSSRAAQRLEAAADAMLQSIPAGSSDWEKALYLHDALIRHVTYEEGPRDQTAYGALVEGKAVCMGYAMAYEYLLKRAGVECDTVIGYTDELSAALDSTIFQADQHAWTIVTFRENGAERSYYVDTTWDDTGMTDAYGREYISHRWFCVTQEDIDREGRSTLQEGYDLSLWNLDDDTMNYYVHTDSMISSYDLARVIEIMQRQISQGSNCPSVRMADLQTFYDLSFAMEENGDFQRLGEALGIGTFSYSYAHSYLGDGLLCFTIYLNPPET